MKKQIFKSKFWVVLFLCFVFIMPTGSVFAQHHGGEHGGHGEWHGDRHSDWYGGWDWGYHHPHGYHWYDGSWWLGDAIVSSLVIGATIAALSPAYTIVYVNGIPYYYDNGYYFRPYGTRYIVVADPMVPVTVVPATPPTVVTIPAQPQAQSSGTVTINVPNSKGGFTPVQLTKYKDGYLGPQGEYYAGNPSVEQLKALYGQ